jgi:hypothetical protein
VVGRTQAADGLGTSSCFSGRFENSTVGIDPPRERRTTGWNARAR